MKGWLENKKGMTKLKVLAGEIGIHDAFLHKCKPLNACCNAPFFHSTVM